MTTRAWLGILLCSAISIGPWWVHSAPIYVFAGTGGEAEGSSNTSARKSHEVQEIAGWTIHVHRKLLTDQARETRQAMELLRGQLEEVRRVVPQGALAELQKVPIWLSPEYPDRTPAGEYHPSAKWLRDHGRDPAMAKAIEFTNVGNFEAECRRMPMMALHELAHAYHDRVLGFDHREIQEAYEKAKASGRYERVERRDAQGKTSMARAYALTNAREYFAETTEAFFETNDFFPYTRADLEKHDPDVIPLLERLWGTTPPK